LGEHLVVGAIALIPNKIAIASLRRNAIALMLDRERSPYSHSTLNDHQFRD
jgi:hypothetical protein